MNDNNDNNKLLRVAIIHTSNHKPEELQTALKTHDIEIVAVAELSTQCLQEIDPDNTDAILVDLYENAEQELDILESLLEESTLPLLFNDNATTQFNISISSPDWSDKLASKLRSLAEKSLRNKPVVEELIAEENIVEELIFEEHVANEPVADIPVEEPPAAEIPILETPLEPPVEIQDLPVVKQTDPGTPNRITPARQTAAELQIESYPEPDTQTHAGQITSAEKIWVLGASLGGPMAVRDFLSCLPENLPIAFVLAQHIGASHIELLGEQLNRATTFNVMTAKPGHIIQNQEVILAPIEEKIILNQSGAISIEPLSGHSIYTPSIDDVMTDVANNYGPNIGTIIFSGMGNDGEEGCQVISEKGGVVWAQEPDSCVISSMPDCARNTGCVTSSGTPEELAIALVEYLI